MIVIFYKTTTLSRKYACNSHDDSSDILKTEKGKVEKGDVKLLSRVSF